MKKKLRIAMIAGEPSGDYLGAGLIHYLRKKHPNIEVVGVGGQKMISEGLKSLLPMKELSVMGISDVLKRYPKLWLLQKKLINYFITTKPDVFIGIDAPDFNLGIEKKLKENGIKAVHYVSPKVWAWRQKRVFKIKKSVDLMLTLFPFEQSFYNKHGVSSTFVGHPMADDIALDYDPAQAKRDMDYKPEQLVIGLLPGSRLSEIKHMGPLFRKVVELIKLRLPEAQFILPCATNNLYDHIQKEFQELSIKIIKNNTQAAIASCDVALVKSGTATLETMLLKKPMVVAYTCSWLTYKVIAPLIKVPYISLPNLLAKKKLIKEFIQDKAKADVIAQAIIDLLKQDNKALKNEFSVIHRKLKNNAEEQASEAILKLCSHTSVNISSGLEPIE